MINVYSRFSSLFIEYGIYLYLVIMFLNKGESIKNIALYGAFGLWVFSGTWRERNVYRHPIALLFWGYVLSILLSTVFSIDRGYSFNSLRDDVVKAVVLFSVLATSFSTEQQLKRLSVALSVSALLMIVIGFYSYITLDIPLLKPHTALMYAWHNRFARYLCLTTPFAMGLLLTTNNQMSRIGLSALIISGSFALTFSTSRGGMLSAVLIVAVWMLFTYKRNHRSLKKIVLTCSAIAITILLITLSISPALKTRLAGTVKDIKTVNLRSAVWEEALEGAKKKPVFGWGYGSNIFHRPEPHVDPAYISPTKAGPENMFISILFHQGLVGLAAYCSLIITAVIVFFRSALRAGKSLSAYMLVTVCGIIMGNFVGHSLVAVEMLRSLAIVLAIGIAAEKNVSKQEGTALSLP
jgi:O-antigen ligase